MVEIDMIFSFSKWSWIVSKKVDISISKELPKLPEVKLKFSKRTKVELVARDLIFKLYLDK